MKKFQEFTFKSKDGYKLEASLTLPKTEPPYPLVIACHGFSSNKNTTSLTGLERRLLPLGIAVFRFSYRAHGKSEGSWKDLTMTGVAKDISDAIEYLFKNHSSLINKDKVFLSGGSFSGLPVLIVAAKDKRIKYLICRSGVVDFKGRLERLYDVKQWKEKGYIKSPTDQPRLKYFSYKLFTDGVKYYGFKIGEKITTPTLLLHGSKDVTVKPYHSKKLFKHLKSKDKELKIIKGADHWYRGKRRKMHQVVVDWIKERKG